ncbi:hypothetical protein PUN28_011005 [Cardiocondyla obscurior]|uniref:Uncharacterized protein n=1 Tax=Cardiocondyla obscurior TaxID=286306 RepID=A0AAW2FN68_9HYME
MRTSNPLASHGRASVSLRVEAAIPSWALCLRDRQPPPHESLLRASKRIRVPLSPSDTSPLDRNDITRVNFVSQQNTKKKSINHHKRTAARPPLLFRETSLVE